MLNISRAIAIAITLAIAGNGVAEPLVTFGFREGIFRIDRRATFDGLQSGDIIVVHEEDGLAFSFGPESAPQRLYMYLGDGMIGPYLYGNGCSREPFVAIRTSDGASIRALSLTAGSHAYTPYFGYVRWEIRRMGEILGSGTTAFNDAALMLVTDENGFDELRLAADGAPFPEGEWGARNCLHLDNVLATIASDNDGDGVFDADDQCPDSEAAAIVDFNGCTQAQHCGTVAADDLLGVLACITTDWREDEQSVRFPRDCRVRREDDGLVCVMRY